MTLKQAIVIALSLLWPDFAAAEDDPEALARYDDQSQIVINHDAFDQFLGAYVHTLSDGRTAVDYAGVSALDRQSLKDYVDMLEGVDPTSLPRDEAFAYWVNLYNAVTLDIVLERYPVGSILRITSGLRPGPWKRKAVTVNGRELALDDIEHAILRAKFRDNRVHYAVNCASISCPNLRDRAFRGASLDVDLDAAARAYVNHPRGARFEGDRLVVSSIYKWFQEDFGGDDAGVIEHLKAFAASPLREKLLGATRIARHYYDWSLNDFGSAK